MQRQDYDQLADSAPDRTHPLEPAAAAPAAPHNTVLVVRSSGESPPPPPVPAPPQRPASSHRLTPADASVFLFETDANVPDVCLPQRGPTSSFDLDALSTAIQHLRRGRTQTFHALSELGGASAAAAPDAAAGLSGSPRRLVPGLKRLSSYLAAPFSGSPAEAGQDGDATDGSTWTSADPFANGASRAGTAVSPESAPTPTRRQPTPPSLFSAQKRFLLYTTAHGILQANSLDELDDEIRACGVPPAYASLQPSTSASAPLGLADVIRCEARRGGWFWLDVLNPSESEMQLFVQIFAIHPLTSEDILSEDTREKCESFPHYYYVNMRSFESDPFAASFLQPRNINMVVLNDAALLSFHRAPAVHVGRVLKRMEQLMLYGLRITPDWLNYALLDDIVDTFAPLLQSIELEVDSIDDLVLILTESEQTDMLRRIARERKKVMALLRLLSNKPDVIRTLIKRRTDRGVMMPSAADDIPAGLGDAAKHRAFPTYSSAAGRDLLAGKAQTALGASSTFAGDASATEELFQSPAARAAAMSGKAQPLLAASTEFVYYLGDIQDNLVTMLINLTNYEKTLSRSHSNYLAQISIELTQASNQTNDHVMKMSVLGSIFLPMNVICGLFGMNVRVPFEGLETLGPFFGIIAGMLFIAIATYWWLRQRQLEALNADRHVSSIDDALASRATAIRGFSGSPGTGGLKGS